MAAPLATGASERRPIEFAAAPTSRLWIAVCLGLGAAILGACFLLGLGEVLFSLKRQVLEAIVQPKVS